jgi:epoxyqueuosine reductase QueG
LYFDNSLDKTQSLAHVSAKRAAVRYLLVISCFEWLNRYGNDVAILPFELSASAAGLGWLGTYKTISRHLSPWSFNENTNSVTPRGWEERTMSMA